MKDKEKMWSLLGNIDNKYIDEAVNATRLGRSARRRFMSLGNIAAVFVGLVAVTCVVAAAFWLSGAGLFQPGSEVEYDPYIQNGEYIQDDEYILEPTLPGHTEKALTAAEEFLLQMHTIFMPVAIYPWEDISGAAYIFVSGETQDDTHFINLDGARITDAPFIREEYFNATAYRFSLFDDGSGIPIIFVMFRSHWVTMGVYEMFIFDSEQYMFAGSPGGFGGTAMQIEGGRLSPYVNDNGDLIFYMADQLSGSFVVIGQSGEYEFLGSYTIGQENELGDVIYISNMTEDGQWDPIVLPREDFEALRDTPGFFALFPDMPEGNFRPLERMVAQQEHMASTIQTILQQQIPVAPPSHEVIVPTPWEDTLITPPNPRYEYMVVWDDRTTEHFVTAIIEGGFEISEPEPLETHWDLLYGGVSFHVEDHAFAQIFEFNDVRARAMAFDQVYNRYQSHGIWVHNGKFAIETNHEALREFFITID
ncbi:MAG: hypothetical protein FWE42_03800 [Defluviitaleaceae bacterium]|nr:hypothetical protein [Defluviitaleaceae bacterium]